MADTIFTCTTFFDCSKGDKWSSFCKAMDSFAPSPRIATWVVVNECSETSQDWTSRVAKRYPQVVFVQKTKDQKGQAASLNLILDMIRPYKYWIQWEESWYSTRDFWNRAFEIMDESDITQLQFTPDWLDIDPMHIHRLDDYCIIVSSNMIDSYKDMSPYSLHGDEYLKHWPLYSLRPSINRVAFHTFGGFSTDPDLWPVRFEWDFAMRWWKAGGKKAVFVNAPVQRDPAHCSTYSNMRSPVQKQRPRSIAQLFRSKK